MIMLYVKVIMLQAFSCYNNLLLPFSRLDSTELDHSENEDISLRADSVDKVLKLRYE